MTDVDLHCECGAFRAVARNVSPRRANRCICYCSDCQAFARYLGKAETVLNAHGGTQIVQLSAGSIEILAGQDQLDSIRLTPGGPVRWFTRCCRTPLANTVEGSKMPFAGVIWPMVSSEARASADAIFGPLKGTVHGKHALGDTSGLDLHPGIPPLMALRLVRLIGWWKLQGAAGKSPLHRAESVNPTLLGIEEVTDLKKPPIDAN